MAKTFQFDEFDKRKPHCIACEEMLADALDESLGEVDQAWFDGHIATCAECSRMLADARRGAAWLEMLKTPRPEPSARLVERILAQTTGEASGSLSAETTYQPRMVPAAAPIAMPAVAPANLLAFRPREPRFASWSPLSRSGTVFESRLAMTAAMAFFSVALTLNLTGVQLNRLHLSDLKPANLKHTYYAANAEAARYYDNLRVVRVMESRVEDLRQASADDTAKPEAQPEAKPQAPAAPQPKSEEKKPEAGPGMSRRESPVARPQILMTEEKIRRGGEAVATMNKHAQGGLV